MNVRDKRIAELQQSLKEMETAVTLKEIIAVANKVLASEGEKSLPLKRNMTVRTKAETLNYVGYILWYLSKLKAADEVI